MSTVRANIFTDNAGGNTASFNGIPLRQGVLDPENRIINGAFDFWQRGTSFTTDAYAADRWLNTIVGGTVTMSRQSFAAGDTFGSNNPSFFLRQTVSGQSLASHQARVAQKIEGVQSYAGQTITVLFWARRSSGSGNMTVEALQLFGSGGSPSANVTGIGATTVALATSWAPYAVAVNVPSIAGKTLGTSGNDFLQINFWTSTGSNFDARSNSLGLQTIGVDLWGIHIKLGTHTTAACDLYKQPEIGPELARCQRYYEIGAGTLNAYYTGSSFGGGTTRVDWKCVKRVAPTISLTAGAGAGSITTFSNLSSTDRMQVWWGSGANATDYREFTYTADAEL